MKEVMEPACGLDMRPGLNGVRYEQRFVKAPMSLHPKKESAPKENFEASEAMKQSMGC